MKKIIYSLTALLLFGTVACFEDKGNYDYDAINRFTVNLDPAVDEVGNIYWVLQPIDDTLKQGFIARVDQTLASDTTTLRDLWYSSKDSK